jgi:hypothetical protein
MKGDRRETEEGEKLRNLGELTYKIQKQETRKLRKLRVIRKEERQFKDVRKQDRTTDIL